MHENEDGPYVFDQTDVESNTSSDFSDVIKYLNKPCEADLKNLSQVHEYPIVKRLYIKFNCIMVAEADIERLFSYAGMILRPQRSSMGPDIFEKLLILHSNDYENIIS